MLAHKACFRSPTCFPARVPRDPTASDLPHANISRHTCNTVIFARLFFVLFSKHQRKVPIVLGMHIEFYKSWSDARAPMLGSGSDTPYRYDLLLELSHRRARLRWCEKVL